MPIKLTSTKAESSKRYANMIVYGESGIGKTTLASTLNDLVIISAEDGLLSLADYDIPTIDVRTFKEFQEAYSFLKKDAHKFRTVFIDSISEIAQTLLLAYKSEERDVRQAYQKMADDVIKEVRKYKALPLNVIFTAKLARIEDSYSGKTNFGPSFPGQVLNREMPYQLDLVLAMRFLKHKGVQHRVIQTEADLQWNAKDRSGKLQKFEKPNLATIISKAISSQVVNTGPQGTLDLEEDPIEINENNEASFNEDNVDGALTEE